MQPRDWDLLGFLEEQGFATQRQLEQEFFSSKSFCSERLKKLTHFGYLGKKAIHEFFSSPDGIKKGYFPHILNLNISPREQIYFIGRKYRSGFGKSKSLFKPSLLLHQLILNEIRMFLEKEVAHKWLLNDPKIKILSGIQLGRNIEIVPDLSLEFDNVKIAIELERTPKGNVRYFKRFSFFRDSIYSHVIYYYTDECQLKTLLARAGSKSKFAFAHYTTPNELYSNTWGILSLDEFIYRQVKASI